MENQQAPPSELFYNLKPLSTNKIPSLVTIDSSVSSHPWKPDQFTEVCTVNGTHGIIAEKPEGCIVGFVLGRSVADEFEITKIAVAEACKRKGIGSRLIKAIIKQASSSGAAHIYLEVGSKNTAAIKLYEKNGFYTQYTRKKYFTNNSDDALVMSLKLR